jgi:hypothetical protein
MGIYNFFINLFRKKKEKSDFNVIREQEERKIQEQLEFQRKEEERKRQELLELQRKQEERKRQEQLELQRKLEERKRQEQLELQRRQEEENIRRKQLKKKINWEEWNNNFIQHKVCIEPNRIKEQDSNNDIACLKIKLDKLKHDVTQLETMINRSNTKDAEMVSDLKRLLSEEKNLNNQISQLSCIRNKVIKKPSKKEPLSKNRRVYEYISPDQIQYWKNQLNECKESIKLLEIVFPDFESAYRNEIIICERILKGYDVNGFISSENYYRLNKTILNLSNVMSKKSFGQKEIKIEDINNLLQIEKELGEPENVFIEKQDIIGIINKRRIKYLAHFTRLENLVSILENGLIPVSMQLKKDIKSIRNDNERWDSKLDCTSCSIEFPNYRVFYSFRNKYPNSKWVVLLLDTEVLLSKDRITYYCQTNAARIMNEVLNKKELCTISAFENMFSNSLTTKHNRTIHRDELMLRDNFTTDPQAEILISNIIEPKHISRVCFSKHNEMDEFIENNGTDILNRYNYEAQPYYFAPRRDYQFWS